MENQTWNSSPCFSLQYSFIFGYTHSIRVFLSINMSVKVELVKMRTTLELSGGRFSRHPEKILSTASSSLGAMSCHVMSCHVAPSKLSSPATRLTPIVLTTRHFGAGIPAIKFLWKTWQIIDTISGKLLLTLIDNNWRTL